MSPPKLTSSAAPVSVFISYSHKDEDLQKELVAHLATLKRQRKIQTWHAGAIEAGAEWDTEIKQQLGTAQVILLLISHHFIASDYCYDHTMQQAIERHHAGAAQVISIILKPSDWQGAPFSKLQTLPKNAPPITQWPDQDAAFLNVIQGIRKAIKLLQTPSPSPPSSPSSPAPLAPSAPPFPQFSTYTPQTFTGRSTEITSLIPLLSGDCRVLAILGMTGIGKTALAERVVANLMDLDPSQTSPLPYYRFSLDDRSLTSDFSSSGAALLRTLGEEPTLADQTDPANLLTHILTRLGSHPCRLQIDSLERLLQGDDETGWSEFCDPLWLDLLQRAISATHCPSQLLLTS